MISTLHSSYPLTSIPLLTFLKQERYFISHGLALNYQLLKGNYDHIN